MSFREWSKATDLNELRAEREPYPFGEHTLKYNKIIKILEDEINEKTEKRFHKTI